MPLALADLLGNLPLCYQALYSGPQNSDHALS